MKVKQVMATAAVSAMLGFGPAIASAQDGPYFGVFWGKSMWDVDKNDLDAAAVNLIAGLGGRNSAGASSLNDSDSAWGVQIGYRFNRFVAAELGYVDLGKANYVGNLSAQFGSVVTPTTSVYEVGQRFSSSGPTIAALGMFPIGERFDVYGRGGILFADTRYRVKSQLTGATTVPSTEAKAGTQEFFGGFGFAWNISEDYALRAEATYFNDLGDDDRTGEASVTMLSLGFVFR